MASDGACVETLSTWKLPETKDGRAMTAAQVNIHAGIRAEAARSEFAGEVQWGTISK